jgi:hypothetical protein
MPGNNARRKIWSGGKFREADSLPLAKGTGGNRIHSAPELRLARLPFFGYCSCPSPMIHPFSHVTSTAFAGAVLALLLAGCERPEIRVYTVAKEVPQATPEPSAETASRPPKARPQVAYTLPAGWQEAGANSLSLLNFRIASPDGDATVNITPLAGMAGRESAIVNMWREQVGQPPLDEKELAAVLTPVEIAGEPGQLFEITGTRDGKPLRIVTAFAHRPDGSWFYKLQGSEAVVAAQKPAFVEFLKSVRIKEGSPSADDTAATPPTAPDSPMVAPEGWKALPAGQMQVAKFAVPEHDGAKAEVSVSVFPSDTGGTLANVNRWRRQLGLTDIDEAGLPECVTPLGGATIDGAPGPVLADLTHENRRLLGAIVPREGRWWFYKMLGDAAAVNAERDAFVRFIQSQP